MATKGKTSMVLKRKPTAGSARLKINSPLSVLPTLFHSPDPQDALLLQRFAQNKEASHSGKFAKVKESKSISEFVLLTKFRSILLAKLRMNPLLL
jgi:hypothetical protein